MGWAGLPLLCVALELWSNALTGFVGLDWEAVTSVHAVLCGPLCLSVGWPFTDWWLFRWIDGWSLGVSSYWREREGRTQMPVASVGTGCWVDHPGHGRMCWVVSLQVPWVCVSTQLLWAGEFPNREFSNTHPGSGKTSLLTASRQKRLGSSRFRMWISPFLSVLVEMGFVMPFKCFVSKIW